MPTLLLSSFLVILFLHSSDFVACGFLLFDLLPLVKLATFFCDRFVATTGIDFGSTPDPEAPIHRSAERGWRHGVNWGGVIRVQMANVI
jgi:hypothetical protein